MVQSNPNNSNDPWIGIDLGTTFSACGLTVEYLENEEADSLNVIILQNPDNGDQTTPSVVQYTQTGDTLVGQFALKRLNGFANTVYDTKRMFGQRFSDRSIQEHIGRWPFEVIDDGKDRPIIKLKGIQKRNTDPKEDMLLYPE